MKEQINRFARGVFEYEPAVIRIKDSLIDAVVDKNREYVGVIEFEEATDKNLKGIIYTDNDKVLLKSNTFFGNKVRAEYEVDCKDALNGDVIEGVFNIVSNGGEKSIPYTFRVEAGSHDSSVGVVRSLSQFADLAKTNPLEALKLFEAEDFEDVYIGDDMTLRCVYEGLCKGADARSGMEEFLIAIHKKSTINITLPKKSELFRDLTSNYKDTIMVERDSWGFMDVSVYTDAPFIRLDRTVIESELFAGGKYELAYIIDVSKLHPGNNYGQIVFETICKRNVFTVQVINGGLSEEAHKRHKIRKLDGELMTLYIRFRTHKINVSDWMRESQIILETIRETDDSSPFYRLALAQIYIAGHKDELAKELIENVKDEINAEAVTEYPLYCYFIYVNTLYNKDRAYSKRAAAVVKECYRVSEDWRVLWTLLFMDKELEQNKSLKLLRIKEQFNKGCTSPAMYIEACNILNEQPMLLRVLNSFEINVLLFGARNGMLDDRLCSQAAAMLLNVKNGTAGSIALLKSLYDMNNDIQILESLCKLLIRSAKVGKRYIEYYGKAIERELKITQLFEYYIISRRMDDMSPLPKMLLMYFSYNNDLDYKRKAYLFANIIHNKADNVQVYKSYIPQMRIFVEKQLMTGHINSHLAYIYKNIVQADMVSEENAAPVSEIYFTYRVECRNPKIRSVVVRHKESNSEKEYPIIGDEAYVRIYTNQAALFFVAVDGNRYCYGIQHKVTRLLEDEGIIRQCLIKEPRLIHVKLSYCEKFLKYEKKTLEAVENIISLSKLPEMSRFYRRKLVSAVIDYFYNGYDEEGFEKFIADVDIESLNEDDIVKVTEIYIIQGKYAKAFELVRKHSAMHIMPKRLMRLCSKLIEAYDYRYLDELAYTSSLCYSGGMYDEVIISYLVNFYNGTTDNMIILWKTAMEQGIDTHELEERIVAQMMFAHSHNELIHDIFENYYAKGANDRIVEAYLAYYSYEYFVRENNISERVFDIIESTLENGKKLAVVCKLALLKYYSEFESLTQFRRELAEELVLELVRRSYIFPFYTKLAAFIKLPFDVVDKTMVEYRTNPAHKVVIHYVYEDKSHRKSYVSEDMNNVYEGIFVKNFVLFYGETVQYYISEESEDGEHTTESLRIVNKSVNPDRAQGRYEALNDIIASRDTHDKETFKKLVHSYAVSECVTEQLFKPL